jgi:hypothetical protein
MSCVEGEACSFVRREEVMLRTAVAGGVDVVCLQVIAREFDCASGGLVCVDIALRYGNCDRVLVVLVVVVV